MTTDPETMELGDYLARGGKLTAPGNAPPRYRAELMRIMSSFVDSELAGSAGFADAINWAPGIRERIAASRIVLEKADHAERVLALMTEFGTDAARYNSAHDWAARLPREADPGAERHGGDMRLSLFYSPLVGWVDAVVMNVLMGQATVIQLGDLAKSSYAPFAEVLREILPRERRHMELGLEGLDRIVADGTGRAEAAAAVTYWRPRVAASFGGAGSARYARLKSMGLRQRGNDDLRSEWEDAVAETLAANGLA